MRAPRTLNEPVGCQHSSFSSSSRPAAARLGRSGVGARCLATTLARARDVVRRQPQVGAGAHAVSRAGPAETRSSRGSPHCSRDPVGDLVAQRHERRHVGSARRDRLAHPERDAPGPRQPRVPAQHAARPPQRERHDRRSSASGGRERPEPERPQARGGDEGPLGEEEHAGAGGERARRLVGVGEALERVRAVDRGMAAAAHEAADHGVGEHLALRDEEDTRRQQREERHHVGVRGVVAGEHERPLARQLLEPDHLDAAATQAQDRPGRGARQREAEAAARHEHHERPGRQQQRRNGEKQPERVEAAADAPRQRPQALGARRAEKPERLWERRAGSLAERAFQVPRPRVAAPELAARGLGHGSGSDEHHPVGRDLDRCGHALGRPRPPGARARPLPSPRVSATTTSASVPSDALGDAEGDHAAPPDALDGGGGLLDLLRHQVAAAP